MHKQEFLKELRKRLSALPKRDVEERLSFFSEQLDDRMEDGLDEEHAVLAIGTPDEVAKQILAELGATDGTPNEAEPQHKKLPGWKITLIAMFAPVWFSLIIAAVAVAVSLYAALWSVVASLWAVFGSFAVAAPVSVLCGIGIFVFESPLTGLALGGAALVLAGLTVFLYFGCLAATKGTVQLTKLLFRLTKRAFRIGGEHRA